MKEQDQLKLCLSCHAQVPKETSLCPYCRVSFQDGSHRIAQEGMKHAKQTGLSYEESLASLYPPPYQPKEQGSPIFEKTKVEAVSLPEESQVTEKQTPPFVPWLLLGAGGYLFVFGFFLTLFATEGKLTLTWSSRFSFLYVLMALPLLWFGYKLANKEDGA